MKGKRYRTEEKIRILREADKGKAITEVCREHNLSQVTFHRWKRQFGQMEVNEAKRLKELERENTELKKMLADSLLKNRVLEAVCEKNCKPRASTADSPWRGRSRDVLWACGVSDPGPGAIDVWVSRPWTERGTKAVAQKDEGTLRAKPALRLPPDRGALAAGRLAGGQTPHSTAAPKSGATRAADQAEGFASWGLHRTADAGQSSRSCLDVGLHCRCDGARRSIADAHHPR